jgi:hypothetical protein
MSWRDDLPEIPSDRIRAEATRDGDRRRRARQRRRQNAAAGAVVAAIAVVLVGGGLVLSSRGDSDDDHDAASGTTAGAAATTAGASGTTEGAATTSAGGSETSAASAGTIGSTAPGTAGGAATTQPGDRTARAAPTEIWEQRDGGAPCGPTEFTVSAPLDAGEVSAVVRWPPLAVGVPMAVDDGSATVTIGPFPAGTLSAGGRLERAVVVIVTDDSGATRPVPGPVVALIAC